MKFKRATANILASWFGVTSRVDRPTYAVSGCGLMILK